MSQPPENEPMAQNDPLEMLYDSKFAPVSYLDAFFGSINENSLLYSPESLSKLLQGLLNLLTHLDYHTTQLSRDISSDLDTLKKLLAPVLSADNEMSGTSRLDYYVSALKNTVDSLHTDLLSTREKLQKPPADDPIDSLLELKAAKIRLQDILKVLQNAKTLIGGDPLLITLDTFQNLLNLLQESLRSRLRANPPDQQVRSDIAELKALLPLFRQFPNFGPTYAKFISKLEE